MEAWTLGDVSGLEALTDEDHLYPAHINELRAAVRNHPFVTIGRSLPCDFLCDGTDDNVQIQEAVNYVGALGGGEIRIKKGIYDIAIGVACPYSNVRIGGEGINSTILKANGALTGGNYDNGILYFFNSVNANLGLNNISVFELSIDLNGIPYSAINFRGCLSSATKSENPTVENVEIYGRGADTSGSFGAITFGGNWTNIASGGFTNIKVKDCIVRDAGITTLVNNSGLSISVLDTDLDDISIGGCRFENTYGSTIFIGGITISSPSNIKITGNTFKNTKNNYQGISSLGDVNIYRGGVTNLIITNNIFDDSGISWTFADDVFSIMVYATPGLVISNNIFKKQRAVIAPGHSFPTGNENIGVTFSDNVIYDCITFEDPDGEWCVNYSDNLFYHVDGLHLSGYGSDYGTKYDGNIFYNCCYDLSWATEEYHKSIFLVEQKGIIIQNNLVWDDLGAGSKLKYFVYELAGNVTGTNPVIIMNNHLMGTFTAMTNPLLLIPEFTNIIRNNIGITTENSGTATVVNGQTTVAVAHGLCITPTADDIMITPTNSMGNATKFYIGTFTATHFSIGVNTDPGATTAIFAWKAIIL